MVMVVMRKKGGGGIRRMPQGKDKDDRDHMTTGHHLIHL